jgi:hypothetical protein
VANPRESTPTVRRAVIVVDATRRRRLLRVLDYIELRHPSIDPDMYRIELAGVAALKALFTTGDENDEISVSFVHDDLFALSVIIDAAETYSTRYGGDGIYGVSPSELDDLRRWVEASERWFITPLKVELLRLDPEMHRRITEVLWYVENRAELIDPDMFRIDAGKVAALQQLFRARLENHADDPPAAAVVAFRDVNTLAYYTMAAREYSARSSEKGLLDVNAAQLDEMLEWLAQAEDRLRSQPN